MAGAHDSSHHLAGNDDGTTLTALRADFPAFRIWREITTGRARYIARRLHPGPGPHTVVTHDLAELRAALRSQGGQAPAGFDLTRPNVARIYNYILGGKDNHLADRQAADSILTDFPEVAQIARANRDFVTRAVHYVATRHVNQFIDVGAGLPAEPAVHQAAQRVNRACRVAYVDNDPLVLVYARALLAAGPGVVVVPGDMREPEGILNHSDLRRLIDLDQPVCVLLASVPHFLLPSEADAAVTAFRAAMAPGSYLILSAGTSTGTSPALLDKLCSAYGRHQRHHQPPCRGHRRLAHRPGPRTTRARRCRVLAARQRLPLAYPAHCPHHRRRRTQTRPPHREHAPAPAPAAVDRILPCHHRARLHP
jgi:hypothetical protein